MYREAVIFRHSFTFLEVASKKHQLLRSDVMFSLSFAVGKEDIVNYDGAQLAEEGRTMVVCLTVKLLSVLTTVDVIPSHSIKVETKKIDILQ
jgi:hypothetical protein